MFSSLSLLFFPGSSACILPPEPVRRKGLQLNLSKQKDISSATTHTCSKSKVEWRENTEKKKIGFFSFYKLWELSTLKWEIKFICLGAPAFSFLICNSILGRSRTGRGLWIGHLFSLLLQITLHAIYFINQVFFCSSHYFCSITDFEDQLCG